MSQDVSRRRGEYRLRQTSAPRLLRVFGMAAIWLLLTQSVLAQAPSEGSPLSLSQAVGIALEKNPLRKAALADTRAAAAGVVEARSFLMPHITFSETATRGDDPCLLYTSDAADE